MSEQNQKTVNLNYQGRVDGKVEAFDVNGMMAIPYDQDGVVYVSWENVVDFFPQASTPLPEGSAMAAEVIEGFLKMTSAKFDAEKAEKLQRVIGYLRGKTAIQPDVIL